MYVVRPLGVDVNIVLRSCDFLLLMCLRRVFFEISL